VHVLAVKIGGTDPAELGRFSGQLSSYGDHKVETASLEPDASLTSAIDAVLDRRDGRRLIVDAPLAGLSAVLHRLHRRDELASADTAVLCPDPGRYLTGLGLPVGRSEQLALAVTGRPSRIGVIKDDSGGICLDSAILTPWTESEPGRSGSEKWWVRAVVDDQRLCDGPVRELTVRRTGLNELEATVRLGRLRSRSCTGRSLQLACEPAQIVADGVGRERPRSKRTFWSEPTLWNLVLPAKP
jgi:hypothetical protein